MLGITFSSGDVRRLNKRHEEWRKQLEEQNKGLEETLALLREVNSLTYDF